MIDTSKVLQIKQSIQTYSVPEVYSQLNTGPEGLSREDAEQRLKQFGRNVIQQVKGKPLVFKLLANFTHLMAMLLWVAGIIAFAAKMPQLALAVWLVNLINGAFSFWQEFKAEKATEALRNLLPVYARVVRNGEEQRMIADELVPGDVILLAEGDRISADGRLVQEAELRVDQSTFTGESHPARKMKEPIQGADLSRPELHNLIFAGTNVVAGTGKAVVFSTGMNTEFGKIAGLTQKVGDEPSPIQKEMRRVTKTVTVIAVTVGSTFFILAAVIAGISLAESFIFAVGMIVAFVPEGLLPTVTLSLALGVQRMAKRHAIIKKLSAVETLGTTTVICTDKTGTLTQNEMTVRQIWMGGQEFSVTGVGYNPQGEIVAPSKKLLSPTLKEDLRMLLLAAALCNNSRLLSPENGSVYYKILGDPTEAALKVAALKGNLDLETESRSAPRLRELPFDSQRRRMSSVHKIGTSRIVFTKGAPREVLALCSRIRTNGREETLSDQWRNRIMETNDGYARSGLRVLAVATAPVADTLPPGWPTDAIERNLTFLGLMAMMDPPRPEVVDAVAKCRKAGIKIIMITGDYGLTAQSIAKKVGIVKSEQAAIITGADMETMSDDQLKATLQDEIIIARAAPIHKLRIVSVLKEEGHVVAVTGDGVNDAPALKKADIGVAMGMAGTDVAKEAADMILTDDNFASIINAIEEGRTVYANIKKFVTYIFTSNVPEAVPFILFAFSGGRIPLALNVMQILSIDLGTDIVPALALGAEPPEKGLMDRPPRSQKEHVITRRLLLRAFLFLGPIQAFAVMSAFYFFYWTNGFWGCWTNLPAEGYVYLAGSAMALAAVVTTQIGNIFAQRTVRTSAFTVGLFVNPLILFGILSALIFVSIIIYVPFFQVFFGTASFPPGYWLYLLAISPVLFLADEIRKAIVRKWEKTEQEE